MRKPKLCPACGTVLIIEPNSLYGPPGLRINCPACPFADTATIIQEPNTVFHSREDGRIVTINEVEAEAVRYWRGEEGAPV